MQADAEEAWITVPEVRPDTIVITVPTAEERSSDAPSWAERAESNQMSHMDSSATAVYPSLLRSENCRMTTSFIYFGSMEYRVGLVQPDSLSLILQLILAESWKKSFPLELSVSL